MQSRVRVTKSRCLDDDSLGKLPLEDIHDPRTASSCGATDPDERIAVLDALDHSLSAGFDLGIVDKAKHWAENYTLARPILRA